MQTKRPSPVAPPHLPHLGVEPVNHAPPERSARPHRHPGLGSGLPWIRAFTLLEIMIVVVVIGLLATMAMPAFTRARENVRFSALMNDFRIFAGAFESHAFMNGNWAADEMPGILPAEMEGWINEHQFVSTTPIGGNYDWDPTESGSKPEDVEIAISVRNHNLSEAMVDRLLRKYCNGDRASGRLRYHAGAIFYVVEESLD